MLSDSARLDKMSSGAANVGHRTAATEIARIVLDIAAKENAVQENARGKPIDRAARPPRASTHGRNRRCRYVRHRSNSAFPRGPRLGFGRQGRAEESWRSVHAGAQVRIGHDADALDLLPGGSDRRRHDARGYHRRTTRNSSRPLAAESR